MKYFTQVLIGSATLLFASTLFATTEKAVNCPPTATVKNSIFIQAKYKDLIGWDMITNSFNYQGKEWNTVFGLATIDDVKTSSDALKQGQAIFNSFSLQEPRQKIKGNSTICFYKFTDQYLVVSVTPAIDLEAS